MASQPALRQSGKESRDLACLVAALQSSRSKLDIDYDEFMKLDGAPTKQAAQMRLHRLGKSLGVELLGSRGRGGKVTKGPTTPKTAVKRKYTTPKPKIDEEEEESEGDELGEGRLKKLKLAKASSQMVKLAEDIAGQNGDDGDGEKE